MMNIADFNYLVDRLCRERDNEGNYLNLKSLMITQGSTTYRHDFQKENALNYLWSLSKPIIGITLGIALENGLRFRGKTIDIETPVLQYFEDKIRICNKSNIGKLRKLKLKHLLTLSLGHTEGLLYKSDIEGKDYSKLIEFVLNYDIPYNPGEYFEYSNAEPYLLSFLIHEEIGLNLSEWVNQTLFSVLGISDFEWINYGKYCAAATGLSLSHNDLHKIGRLLKDRGVYNEKRLVSSEWIKQMSTMHIRTPNFYYESHAFPKYGYGFYMWVCKNGVYYCDASYGQSMIIIPEKDMLITTINNQPDFEPMMNCLRESITNICI